MTRNLSQVSPVRQAVVLCGGKGTRLRSITGDALPKVMIDVCGRPLLEYHVELLRRHGIDDVILCTGYLSETIERHFGDGAQFGVRIRYTHEPHALGTAGALVQIPVEEMHLPRQTFMVFRDRGYLSKSALAFVDVVTHFDWAGWMSDRAKADIPGRLIAPLSAPARADAVARRVGPERIGRRGLSLAQH